MSVLYVAEEVLLLMRTFISLIGSCNSLLRPNCACGRAVASVAKLSSKEIYSESWPIEARSKSSIFI